MPRTIRLSVVGGFWRLIVSAALVLALAFPSLPAFASAGSQFYSTLTCNQGAWTVHIYSKAENWVEYSWTGGGYAKLWNPYANYWERNTGALSTWAVVEWDHNREYSGRTCKPV